MAKANHHLVVHELLDARVFVDYEAANFIPTLGALGFCNEALLLKDLTLAILATLVNLAILVFASCSRLKECLLKAKIFQFVLQLSFVASFAKAHIASRVGV